MVSKTKPTDMELFHEGLLKQEETWWGKKAESYATQVRKGKYGQVLSEWVSDTGWFDGVHFPCFAIERNGDKLIVQASESGIFIQSGTKKGCSLGVVK